MARHSETIKINRAQLDEAKKYLEAEGFKLDISKGEGVYRKGTGTLTAPQFIGLKDNGTDEIVLEAWLKYPILPMVFVGEMGITGIFGGLPKKFLRTRVENVRQILTAK